MPMEQDVQDEEQWTRIEMTKEMTSVKSQMSDITVMLKNVTEEIAKLQGALAATASAAKPAQVFSPPLLKVSSTGTTVAGAAGAVR